MVSHILHWRFTWVPSQVNMSVLITYLLGTTNRHPSFWRTLWDYVWGLWHGTFLSIALCLAALCLPYFKPLSQVGLKWLSMKTAFLLAMTPAKHIGELHALLISELWLRWNPDGSGVTLWPNVAISVLRLHGNCRAQFTRFYSVNVAMPLSFGGGLATQFLGL